MTHLTLQIVLTCIYNLQKNIDVIKVKQKLIVTQFCILSSHFSKKFNYFWEKKNVVRGSLLSIIFVRRYNFLWNDNLKIPCKQHLSSVFCTVWKLIYHLKLVFPWLSPFSALYRDTFKKIIYSVSVFQWKDYNTTSG